MKLIILILLTINISYSYKRFELDSDSCVVNLATSIAKKQVGVVEKTNRNDGYMINEYQKSVGIRQGNSKVVGDPYCSAGIYWSYVQAVDSLGLDVKSIPIPKSGSSQVAYTYAQQKSKYKPNQDPEVNDIFIWRKKDSWQGHQGIIVGIGDKGWLYTVEFNTSGNGTTDEREGGGVFIKKRNYKHPLGKLMTRGFVGFKYSKESICDKKIKYYPITYSPIVDILIENKKHHRPNDISMIIYKFLSYNI